MEAIEEYRRATESAPGPRTLLHLALALAESGRDRAAAQTLDQAIRYSPSDPALRAFQAVLMADDARTSDAKAALRECDGGISRHPLAETASLYVRLVEGEIEPVLKALADFPVADNVFVRGRLLLRIEQILLEREKETARAEGTRAGAAKPRDATGRPFPRRMANWLLGRTPRQRARSSVRKGIQAFEQGRNEDAVSLLESALADDPELKEAKGYLGCSLFGIGGYESAAALLAPLVEAGQDDGLEAFYYGATCCKLHRYAEASVILETVAQGQSKFDFQEWLHYFQGLAYLGAGNLSRACHEFAIVSDYSWPFLQERAQAALDAIAPPGGASDGSPEPAP